MKRFLSVLLSLTMLLTCVPLGAVSVSAATMENGLVYEIANGEVTITGHTDDLPAELVIPDTIGGYPVTAIACEAFQGCPFLTSVVISRSVTLINDYAFRGCTALSEIIFLNSTTLIGEAAFYDTAYYNDPANWDQDVLYIDNHLIEAKQSLTGSYAIKEGTLTIAVCAFDYCSSLTSVSIPDSVTHIQVLAFSDCSALTSLTIPKSVTFIGNLAFQRTALTDIYYAGTEEDFASIDIIIGNDPLLNAAWHYSEGTTSTPLRGLLYEINNGEVTITGHTDDVPEHLVIPSTIGGYPVKAIGSYAFHGDYEGYHIVSIVIPEGVETIGGGAFRYAKTLISVDIPDTVTSIGEMAFSFSGVQEVTIPYGVTTIKQATFISSGITSITIPDSVTTIEMEAFYGCKQLTSVEIPDSVTFIGDFAFDTCINLTSVVLPNGLETISNFCFSECRMTSVVIPDSVKTIEEGAFCDVPLTEITLPKNIEKIEAYAFVACISLRDVYYDGTEEDRANIYVGESNDSLLNATWHYNYVEPAELFYPIVNHSVMDTAQGTGLAFRFTLAVKGMNVVWGNVATYANATVNYLGTDCKLLGMGAVLTNRADVNPVLENVNDQNVLDIPAVYLTHLWQESCAFSVRIKDIPANQMERMIYARPYYIVEVNGEAVTVYGDIDAASCQSVSNSIA